MSKNILLEKLFVFLSLSCSCICLSYGVPEDNDRFKRAVNRGYIGFERANRTEWQNSFVFIQGADPQFGLIESYIHNKTDGGWDQDIGFAEKAIKQWNQMKPKPKFVVICGDLVNDYPHNNQMRRDEQIKDFKKSFSKLDKDIPLILLGGNHDLLDRPTNDSISQYRDNFGDDYFSFWSDGVMFIVINVQYYKNHEYVTELYAEHESWLDQQLAEAKNGSYKHIVVFQHIPWFLHNITEQSDNFNIESKIRELMVKKFYDSGVRAIFAGHYHRNAGGFYEDLELVVTSAIGAQFKTGRNANNGFRVVTVNENNITHEYMDIVEKPTDSASINGITMIHLIFIISYSIHKVVDD